MKNNDVLKEVLKRNELKDRFCEILKELINEQRIMIEPYSYQGRGWIDIRVCIDGICYSDNGSSI